VGSGVGGRKHTQDGSREEGGEESLLLPWSLTPLSNMHTLTQSQTSKAKVVKPRTRCELEEKTKDTEFWVCRTGTSATASLSQHWGVALACLGLEHLG